MSKTSPEQKTTLEEQVATALNGEGFLFSQVIREKIRSDRPGDGQPQKAWTFLTEEYSVTAPDGAETRIDLVLRNAKNQGLYLCLECKRMNPVYKQWVFFDQRRGPDRAPQGDKYVESFRVFKRGVTHGAPPFHSIEGLRLTNPVHLFNYYIEVAVDWQRKAGHTKAIEDAFQQITCGQSGFMTKQLDFDGPFHVMAIPAVVTTANLYEACFDEADISLSAGTIEPSKLKLEVLEFCAVNYHANDQLAVRSKYSQPIKTIEHEMTFGQIRTVFVVQAHAILKFLSWLDANVIAT